MTPTDPNPAREADGRAGREGMQPVGYGPDHQAITELVQDAMEKFGTYETAADYLIANRAAVLRALGLHEEWGYEGRSMNSQRRWVSDWEDKADE